MGCFSFSSALPCARAENEPTAVAKRATARTRHFNVLLGIYSSSLKEFEHKCPLRTKRRRSQLLILELATTRNRTGRDTTPASGALSSRRIEIEWNDSSAASRNT